MKLLISDFEMLDPRLCLVVRDGEDLLAVQSYEFDKERSTVYGVVYKVEELENHIKGLLKLSSEHVKPCGDLSNFEVVMIAAPATPMVDTFQVMARFR